MKKIEITRQYDYNATTIFIAASIALVTNSVLTYLLSSVDFPNAVAYVCRFFSVAFALFAFIMTIKGFSKVDKACRLSEENENYYLGRNLKRLSVACLIVSAIVGIAVLIFFVMLTRYSSYGKAGTLTQNDINAANNIKIITALLLIVYELASVGTPYIFYLWNIHKITPKTDSVNNFALLTMIVLVVQLAIGALNSVYTIKGGETSFVAGFSSILLIIKYVLLTLFFITRRKGIYAASKKTEADEENNNN